MTDHPSKPPPAVRFVVLGGGTGILPCLRGLKDAHHKLTAVVTVADDGGSSGRLRKDFYIHPPGDIRNCLVALSTGEPLLAELFNYRFQDSILRGHSLGNLILAVLTCLTGDFEAAISAAADLLEVRDAVFPSTETRVVLVAEHPDGSRSTGEQVISRCGKAIKSMCLRPDPRPVSEAIAAALAAADLVVLGPGSLYTSIIPNLLVPGMTEALDRCPGRVALVSNLMTQPGETEGLDVADHVEALREVGGLSRLDYVVCSATPLPEDVLDRYAQARARPPARPGDSASLGGARMVFGDIAHLTPSGKLRHDARKLAELLVSLARNEGSNRG